MPKEGSDLWQRQYVQGPMSLNHWQQSQSLPMGSVQDSDFRMFHAEHYGTDYSDGSINYDGGPLLSPPMAGYVAEPGWGSDMDIGTPSTTSGLPNESMNAYRGVPPDITNVNHQHHRLNLPPRHDRIPCPAAQSPRSSCNDKNRHGGDRFPTHEERPYLTRSITAPAATDNRPRRVTNASATLCSIKRSGSEDEDDEDVPSEEMKPNRGRKRQRIPHTAVERRYRENLNAHLDKLRQTVPTLASKRAAGASRPGDGLGEGVKPSKCEILNGAIEHIGALDKENSALRIEVLALRARLDGLERWMGDGCFMK